jgi:RNA polymerase sigma-70 factor (ECF subfamily)
MPERAETDDALLEQLWQGNSEVLGELFAAYESYLRAIVRSQLSNRLRSKFDSVDVVQSVWVQLLRRMEQDGCRVNDGNHLRALLVTIARRRLLTRARQCRHINDADLPLDEETRDSLCDFRQDSPCDAAQANDLWTKMLALTPPEHRDVLLMKREGLPLQEIADRTGLHEGSVRRILRRLSRELALQQEPLAAAQSLTSDESQ